MKRIPVLKTMDEFREYQREYFEERVSHLAISGRDTPVPVAVLENGKIIDVKTGKEIGT